MRERQKAGLWAPTASSGQQRGWHSSGAGTALLYRRQGGAEAGHMKLASASQLGSYTPTSMSLEILPLKLPLKATFIPLDLQSSKQVPTVGV